MENDPDCTDPESTFLAPIGGRQTVRPDRPAERVRSLSTSERDAKFCCCRTLRFRSQPTVFLRYETAHASVRIDVCTKLAPIAAFPSDIDRSRFQMQKTYGPRMERLTFVRRSAEDTTSPSLFDFLFRLLGIGINFSFPEKNFALFKSPLSR